MSSVIIVGGGAAGLAAAGVIAMRPACIALDEPTAMLDPKGRAEIMSIIDELHKDGITVVLITHFMEEAVKADRIIIMDDAKVLLDGTPEEVFEKEETLLEANLEIPMAAMLATKLRKRGIKVPNDVITVERLVEYVCQFK